MSTYNKPLDLTALLHMHATWLANGTGHSEELRSAGLEDEAVALETALTALVDLWCDQFGADLIIEALEQTKLMMDRLEAEDAGRLN